VVSRVWVTGEGGSWVKELTDTASKAKSWKSVDPDQLAATNVGPEVRDYKRDRV
jgi:hypothetical protein